MFSHLASSIQLAGEHDVVAVSPPGIEDRGSVAERVDPPQVGACVAQRRSTFGADRTGHVDGRALRGAIVTHGRALDRPPGDCAVVYEVVGLNRTAADALCCRVPEYAVRGKSFTPHQRRPIDASRYPS